MKTATQCDLVLEHLQLNGRLSSLDALGLYGVARLAARVEELRARGHAIQSIPVQLAGKAKKRFISYRMDRGGMLVTPAVPL